MATHSSVLAWRIPGMGEPGGLLSLGSHRVGHDWSDLAAAAAAKLILYLLFWNLLSSPIQSYFWTLKIWTILSFKKKIYLVVSCLSCSMWDLWFRLTDSLVVACGLSSLTRDWTCVPRIARWILNHWATGKVPPPLPFLKEINKLSLLEKFLGHSRTEQKVLSVPTWPQAPSMYSFLNYPHPGGQWSLCYNPWTYTDTSVSPRVHTSH